MKLEFYRGSAVWEFNVANGGYSGATMYVTGAVNWGIAPITRITQRGPFQEGDSDIDYRLNPRVINLPLVVPGETYDEMMNNREKVAAMFRPGNDVATLRHTLNPDAVIIDHNPKRIQRARSHSTTSRRSDVVRPNAKASATHQHTIRNTNAIPETVRRPVRCRIGQ